MIGMKCDGCGAHIAVKHLPECPRCYAPLHAGTSESLLRPASRTGWSGMLSEFSWTGRVIMIVLALLLAKALTYVAR